MKQYLIGFLLGVALCLFMGNKIYHPVRGIITTPQADSWCSARDLQTVMQNQESIFNLIKDRCGE